MPTPAKLQQALVLNKYILSLFGVNDLEPLANDLKDPALEGVDNDGVSNIFYAMKGHLYAAHSIDEATLRRYDENIVRHTKEINEKRRDKIVWKYYQYLALLFTEIYLDRYFANKTLLLEDLNDFLTNQFNTDPNTWHGLKPYTLEDLNKLAFWCATGSGKTLMMHINIKQYLHYAEKHSVGRLNRIIILTPNEGLSNQHLTDLHDSNMDAQLFDKRGNDLFRGQQIEIIDINKLADNDGDKTVAVESFEGNNLVLVDEGHKGSGGEVWKGYRNTLTRDGFSFEYSATFGQAVASQTGSKRNQMLEEYGKVTLFDYSYRYFYHDGYGKDYRILNMNSWDDEQRMNMYLTAYLMCLYEQMLVYESNPAVKNKFLIARPLGIFVGGSVTAVRKVRGQDVSDVVQILKFVQSFVENKVEYVTYIKRLLDPNDGIQNGRGYSLFGNSFRLTKDKLKVGQEEAYANLIYERMMEKLFHSSVIGARLHLDKQKGGDKEIGLRIGNAEYFGVINVGDSDSLMKLCEAHGLQCEVRDFATKSLFANIADETSKINLLIGSKKFSEGWSCWRVSCMGLMNVGRSEGSEIIQLFGRGVRLKGFQYSLKRSTALDGSYNPGPLPKELRAIETLNIFGVRADYMDAFRKYLEDEGLPSNEEVYESIKIPTVNLLSNTKLKVVRLKEDYDFKKDVVVHPMNLMNEINIKLDWTPKVESIVSNDGAMAAVAEDMPQHLASEHLAFLNWNKIFYQIEQMKNERSWWNLELNVGMLKDLMYHGTWYDLIIPKAELEFHNFGKDVAKWQEITVALLRAYIERAYKKSKGRYESQHLETVYLDPNDPNFFSEYVVEVRKDKQEWIDKLKELAEQIRSGNLEQDFQIYSSWIQALKFDRHLYYPLLCLQERNRNNSRPLVDINTNEPLIKISPVALNVGETAFVNSVREYYNAHKDDVLKGKDVYLLRNESRKGIGFFEASNFYPDFILWVKDGEKQHVTFIDPKGIRNLHGLEDSKILLYKLLKDEIEPTLNDPNIVLDSYIISNTRFKDVGWWSTYSEQQFYDNHVYFDDENDYIDVIFNRILS